MLDLNVTNIIDFNLSYILLIIIATLVVLISLKIAFSNNLVEIILLMSTISLMISIMYLLMDAPDIAMTEVALGACISTIVLLKVQTLVRELPKESENINYSNCKKVIKIVPPVIICLILAAILTIIGIDIIQYGSSSTMDSISLGEYYLKNTSDQIGINSIVAAILASYRGFDTLGETTVILIAGIGIILILMNKKNEKV